MDDPRRCGNVVLQAFGIPPEKCSTYSAADVLVTLQKHGWAWKELEDSLKKITVRKFVSLAPKKGKFIIGVSGHGMAYIDGKLVDSEERGADGRRILGAWEVFKGSPAWAEKHRKAIRIEL